MSELPMRGHFRYLRFKTFPMKPRTLQCEVFFPLLLSFEHSGVPEDSKSPTFPSVGLHPPHLAKLGLRHTHKDGKAPKGIRHLMEGIHLRGRNTTVDGSNHLVQLWSCHNGLSPKREGSYLHTEPMNPWQH
jgi:hypothetical protein